MVFELNELSVLLYESSQANEWDVVIGNMLQFKVDSKNPSDEFLEFYVKNINCSK